MQPCLAQALLLLGCSVAAGGNAQARVETARIYGNVNQYAYYFTDLLVGSPELQLTSVIVDTGSHLVGFPCQGCRHCGRHLEPAVNISKSKTARWVKCDDGCKTCREDRHICGYSEGYSEGSSISGLWFEDYVQLGDAAKENPPVLARMGCHDSEHKLFYSQRANGIMGLAPQARYQDYTMNGKKVQWEIPENQQDMPTILDYLFADKKDVNSKVFSICLAEWGGLLTVGGYNQQHHLQPDGSGIQWMPMRASGYYFVTPKMLLLGDLTVAASPGEFGETIVDTGTTLTYFPLVVYNTILTDLTTYCSSHGCGAEQDPDTATEVPNQCWTLKDPAAGPALFPKLFITFGDDGETKVEWDATSYLNKRMDGLWCYAFKGHSIVKTILGISWVKSQDAIFDIQNRRFGLAKAKCPEHRKLVRQPLLWEVLSEPLGLVHHLGMRRWQCLLFGASFAACLGGVAVRFGLSRYRRRTCRGAVADLEQFLEANPAPTNDDL